MHSKDVDILARTIYGEARGEYRYTNGGLAALIAVGNVIMNRLKKNCWFGKTIEEVCLKPWQFSCWNKDDPNLEIIKNVNISDKIFETCNTVAEALVKEQWPDLTGGCDHYHSITLTKLPFWIKGYLPKVSIGRHKFYQIGV